MVEGFKHTGVGEIPNDWKLVSFDDAFDFFPTATYSRAQLTENDKIGYVHYGDIHVKCQHFLDLDKITLPTIKSDLLKNYTTLKDGDLIVVDASEDYEGVGKSVEVRNLKDRKVISGLHTFLLREKGDKIANGFKGYIRSNQLVKKQMDTLATGLKVYGVSKNSLKKIFIPLPPTKVEQTAIATALNDADALIQKLEQLIAKKQGIKTGTMQELLKPRESWEEKTIEELCVPNGIVRGPFGGALKKEYFVPYGYKVYEQRNAIYRNVENGSYYIDKNKFKELQRFEIKANDFIISCSGTIGKIYQIPEKFEKGIINQALLKLTLNTQRYSDKYFYHYFGWDNFQESIIDSTQGGAMKNLIGMADFKKTKIPMPKRRDKQIWIAQILSDMDNELQELKKLLEKYKMMKQGMMQNLLTGKIRLV